MQNIPAFPLKKKSFLYLANVENSIFIYNFVAITNVKV